MTTRPRVVIFAYACEPGRGSEPGAGWGLVRAIADFADCTVIVGPAHIAALRRWKDANPSASLEFVPAAEAPWPAPGERGRIAWFLAYLRWIPNALHVAQSLHATHPFDVACHATYSTYWLPSPVMELGIPSVWGPVGGAVTTPRALHPLLGREGLVTEWIDRIAVLAMAHLPAARRTARRVTVRIVQNEETRQRLPLALRARTRVLNHALFTEADGPGAVRRGRRLVLSAALETRKGVELALRAMLLAPDTVQLAIAGDGPERARLEAFVVANGLSDRVKFLGSIARPVLQKLFAQSSAAVFTGLREEGGLALAEAMYAGTPVIVLDHGGAAAIARQATDLGRVSLVPVSGLETTIARLAAAMTFAVQRTSVPDGPLLDRRAAQLSLRAAFEEAAQQLRWPRYTPTEVDGAVTTRATTGTDGVVVIIPAFNAGRYLAAAMRSALAQTHRNLRLVVVDDGSTDDTLAVAESIALLDERVQVISIANSGRARARNVGLDAAPDAPFVAFLDADDLWDRDKVATQLAALQARPDAIAAGSFMRYISSTDAVLGETGQVIGADDLAAIARGELAPFPISSCLILRRATCAQLGGFDDGLREAEDLDFIARLARLGPILCVERPLGSYRIHPASAMALSRATVNKYARFVRRRIAARDAGGDLAWDDFVASYRPNWRERRRDAVEIWYRSAALWRGEGRTLTAMRYGAMAAVAAPAYTLRRLYRQRVGTLVRG